MEKKQLIERIYNHVESGDTDKASIACLRLARKVGDSFSTIVFLRELYPDQDQFEVAFYEEAQNLNTKAKEFLWKTTAKRWLDERTLDFSISTDSTKNVLAMGVGEMVREVEQLRSSIDDLELPEGMGEYDTAAFTDRHLGLKVQARLKIKACQTILERVRTRCLDYATRIERQIAAADVASDLMARLQIDVQNYYAERCDSAYKKLRKADSLIGSAEPEDHALLLTSIRRAVKAVADHHFPPKPDPQVCLDGQIHELGDQQYLNRLQEFCSSLAPSSASGLLLQAELDYLAVFIRKLHEVASKGVHDEVSSLEAKQGLLGLYMFLSNLIAKLEQRIKREGESESTVQQSTSTGQRHAGS
jgi:hypothetical protein